MTLQYKRRRKPSDSKNKDEKLITLNVSGRRFIIAESTLKKHPKTLLGSELLSTFFDTRTREYFLDRDPHMFRYILNFYRIGKLHASNEDCSHSFKEELNFFGICSTELQPCCWEDDSKVTIRQRRVKKSHTNKKVTKYSRKYLWLLLEEGDSSVLGRSIQVFIALTICISVFFTILESVYYAKDVKFYQRFPELFQIVESLCIGVFTLEYFLRLYASTNKLNFIINKLSVIDLLAFLPFYVDLIVFNLVKKSNVANLTNILGVFRVLRIVRIVKLSRHFSHMRVVGHMMKVVFVDLGFLFFGFFLANVMFSTVMFYLEYDGGRSHFTSIPNTMWYTVVTMMTVGDWFSFVFTISDTRPVIAVKKTNHMSQSDVVFVFRSYLSWFSTWKADNLDSVLSDSIYKKAIWVFLCRTLGMGDPPTNDSVLDGGDEHVIIGFDDVTSKVQPSQL